MGMTYGVLVELFPIVAIGAGVGFGLVIWIGAHELVMPLMGLTPATWALPASEQGSEFFGHALWGLLMGVFCAYFRGMFARPAVMTIRDEYLVSVPVAERVDVY